MLEIQPLIQHPKKKYLQIDDYKQLFTTFQQLLHYHFIYFCENYYKINTAYIHTAAPRIDQKIINFLK